MKTKSIYGEGYNYWWECGFNLAPGFLSQSVEKVLHEVAGQFDHVALGVDLDLAEPATSAYLLKRMWEEVERRLSDGGRMTCMRLCRGDGVEFSIITDRWE